jgi:nitrogen fixation protein NifU and related proteins
MTAFIDIFVSLSAIFLVSAAWLILHYYANQVIDNPDGIAKTTEIYADTMEIGLQFHRDKAQTARCWTNSCSFSKLCLETAAMLAQNKSIHKLQNNFFGMMP